MGMNELERKFETELIDKMQRAKKECKYNPTRFNQMIAQHGGVETARRLIQNGIATGRISDGFGTLCMCGRLDLTMEHSACKSEYRSLFTSEEIDYCKGLLGNK